MELAEADHQTTQIHAPVKNNQICYSPQNNELSLKYTKTIVDDLRSLIKSMTGIILVKFLFFFELFHLPTKFQRLLDVIFPPFFPFDWVNDQFVSVIKSETKKYHNCAESNRKYQCTTQRHVVFHSKRGKFHFFVPSPKYQARLAAGHRHFGTGVFSLFRPNFSRICLHFPKLVSVSCRKRF